MLSLTVIPNRYYTYTHQQAIPQVATAPVLVLVGAMMMGESTHIDWSSMLTAIPAFLTIVIQPFTFSIANGIYAGLVMSVMLYILTGQFMEYFQPATDEKEMYEDAEEDDVETPLINGHHGDIAAAGGGAGGPTPPIAATRYQPQQPQEIPGGSVRRSSYGAAAGSLVGSYRGGAGGGGRGSGTPYERGSFTMYINTFGSHTSPGGRGLLGGTRSQVGSEDPEGH